ncbi:DNA polymerase III subunit gamma/tau, partial [Methylocystis sp. 9N]
APRVDAPPPSFAPAPERAALANFDALVALAAEKRDIQLKIALESEVRLLRFEPGRIEFELAPGGTPGLASTLTQKLQAWTGERWMISVVASGGAPTIKEKRDASERERRSGLESDPFVASVLARFPGAQIIAVRGREEGAASSETLYDDMLPPADDDGEAQ